MTASDAITACIDICKKHKLDSDYGGSMAIQEMRKLLDEVKRGTNGATK